ncbi:nitroreductase [Sphingobium sp. V4]|uniref:nitroreductase n=1 Tax=Sphingobium sp. V4 TaxID=3038927 RepID=UPI0025580637|nr:nitroreductase [Sphingobium sp. V4]WIW89931.1 nitroreductase [Sphingobium sp. V4]
MKEQPEGTSQSAVFFEKLVRDRRSVRGFRTDPVPKPLLEKIFTTAQQAPSNCNTQPWIAHVVSGGSAERVRTLMHEAAVNRVRPTPDIPIPDAYTGEYRARQIGAAVALFGAQGIARNDVVARNQSFLRNFRFFDAPHAVFIFIPPHADIHEASDCGIYIQTLLLAFTANGLASCAQGALSHYADIVHRELNVPDEHRLLVGIAFGYPDEEHPANAAVTERVSLLEAVTFHE